LAAGSISDINAPGQIVVAGSVAVLCAVTALAISKPTVSFLTGEAILAEAFQHPRPRLVAMINRRISSKLAARIDRRRPLTGWGQLRSHRTVAREIRARPAPSVH
jgi:hypothetical protein